MRGLGALHAVFFGDVPRFWQYCQRLLTGQVDISKLDVRPFGYIVTIELLAVFRSGSHLLATRQKPTRGSSVHRKCVYILPQRMKTIMVGLTQVFADKRRGFMIRSLQPKEQIGTVANLPEHEELSTRIQVVVYIATQSKCLTHASNRDKCNNIPALT